MSHLAHILARLIALTILVGFSMWAPPARALSCPAHAYAYSSTESGNHTDLYCHCDGGYHISGGACVAIETTAIAAPGDVPACVRAGGPAKPGTVNPGDMVTRSECLSARAQLKHLHKLEADLQHKLAELDGWQRGLARDDAEFERMRTDAQKDLVWEFLEHLPVAEGLDQLKETKSLKGVDLHKIEAGYAAAKGLLETGRGIANEEDRSHAIFEGNRELRNAMMSASGMNEETAHLLETASKIMDAGAEIALSDSNAPKVPPMTDRDKLKLGMSVIEALAPVAGAGVLTEDLAERYGEYHYAGVALDSLRDAESSNWNARRYLTDKLAKTSDTAAAEEASIIKYRSGGN